MAIRYNLPETVSTYKGEPLNSLEMSEMQKYLSMGDLRRDLENLLVHNPSWKGLVEQYRQGGLRIADDHRLKDQRFYMLVDQIFRRHKEIAMQQVLQNNPDLKQRLRIRAAKRDLGRQNRYQELMNLPK